MGNIQIGKYICVQKPIKVQGIRFDMDDSGKKELYVNKLGQPVKKIQVSKSEYKWVNTVTQKQAEPSELTIQTKKDGKLVAKKGPFKAKGGKPVMSFNKTTMIDKYDIIDNSKRANFIENELTYQLINPELKAEVKKLVGDGKLISFKYVNSGFKIHRACIDYMEEQDTVLMRCYRGDLSKVDLTETINTTEIVADEGVVEQLSLDDLEA